MLVTLPVTSQETIPVSLTVVPHVDKLLSVLVPTGVDIKANAAISDSKFLTNMTTYRWSTKDGPIKADPSSRNISIKFNKPDETNFIKVDVSHIKPNTTINDTGSAQFDFTLKAPLVVSDPVGKLFLEHGELLNINLSFTGSKPFSYCYKFCADDSILPCDLCLIRHDTYDDYLPINQYLHQVGNYTLMLDINNDYNREIKHYTIRIIDSPRNRTLPFAPIVSSILAVLILLTGVGLHLHFRKTAITETANFDFIGDQDDDEWEQEQSFLQRVRFLLCRGDADEMTESQLLVGDRIQANETNSRY